MIEKVGKTLDFFEKKVYSVTVQIISGGLSMKKFEQPEVNVTIYEVKDILTTSVEIEEDVQGMPIEALYEHADR